jgi:hypothetical protein
MRKPFEFIDAVRREWGALVTSGALIGVLGLWQDLGHPVLPGIYWAVGIGGFLFAGYRAWLSENSLRLDAEKRIYDGRPVFVLEIRMNAMGWWTFYLRNCGNRTARYVRLQSLESGAKNYTLHFAEITVLEPNSESAMRIGVNDSWDPNYEVQEMLLKFLRDNPAADDPLQETVITAFDAPIKFRDMDESAREAVVRFYFDVDRKVLSASAVPYTEKSAAKLLS